MASLTQIAKEQAKNLRDGIYPVAVWKTGRSWHAEELSAYYYHEESGFDLPEDEQRAREIAAIDNKAVFLYCGEQPRFASDATLEEIAFEIRRQYENSWYLLSEWLEEFNERKNAVGNNSGNAKNTKDGTLASEEEKIIERIDAMPIEELVEIVKKSFEDSHIPYTIEEGGKILFPGIFTDESRSPPDN